MFTFPSRQAAERAVAQYRADPAARPCSVHYVETPKGWEARGSRVGDGIANVNFLFRNYSA